ncbi:unnamed protein product [Penicillium salamii]|nr:unnamed protein product [Penicillium salamii]CAG8163875.1 unnamed protein product [Penicillium salamii]CAG8429422.1 unnamed protein product [Penicillium salamii]
MGQQSLSIPSPCKRPASNSSPLKTKPGMGTIDEIEPWLPEYSDQEYFQMGVDFVLSLERPCLYHTQNAQPNRHTFSMQGTLLQYAPPTLATDTQWEVSAEVFQKLFEMADRLDLDGYITPVQAWNRIRDHENFSQLTREKLKILENNMRPNIKCQGFAAIMEEPIFEILLNQALGS